MSPDSFPSATTRTLYAQLGVALFLHDPDNGRILYLNSAAEELFSSPAEVMSQGPERFSAEFEPYTSAEALTWLKRAQSGPQCFEWLARDGTGLLFWVEVNLKACEIESRPCVMAICRDITATKRTEKELREREALFRTIFDNADLGMALLGPHGLLITANEQLAGMIGYSMDELLKLSPRSMTHPEDWPGEKVAFRELLGGKRRRLHLHKRYVRKDGSNFHARLTVTAVPGLPRDEASYVMLVEDVTLARQAEAERARLATAIEQAAECIAVAGPDLKLEYVNPTMERFTGRTREELLGQPLYLALEDPEEIAALIRDLAETGPGETLRRTFLLRGGNTVREVDSVISPVHDSEGRLVNHVAVGRDMTAEVRLRQQLQQAQKIEAVGNLAGGIAHELNNILTPILGYASEALDEVEGNEAASFCLEQVLAASTRARELVGSILAFARKGDQKRAPISLGEPIREAVRLLRSVLPSNIRLATRIDTSDDVVLASSTQIHQILVNLCTNAAQALDGQPGAIEVTLAPASPERPAPAVELTVSDTGPGIVSEHLPRVFEPFFTTKRPGQGTGMGLAVVHGMVSSLGGEIAVASRPGQGAVFRLTLPLHQGHAAAVETSPQHPARGRGRLLFVDDDPSITMLMQKQLASLGFDVVVAEGPRRCLEIFGRDDSVFDLVITDQVMPDMSGVELAGRLREMAPGQPILLCSGNCDPEALSNGDRLFCGHLRKPFKKHEVAAAIFGALAEGSAPRKDRSHDATRPTEE